MTPPDVQPPTSSDESSGPPLSDETSPERGEDLVPNWLPEDLRDWVTAHRTALDAVFDAFTQDAQWPDPVQLQRQQRAAGGHPAIARALAEMPRQLGWREYEPPRARLSLFGIACCRESAPLLSLYYQLLQLALQRHSQTDAPNRLYRHDADELTRDPVQARLLSRVVLEECPFLGSGSSELDSWDREIDERVVEYEHARSIDDFLTVLAEQRGLTVAQPDGSAAEPAAAAGGPPVMKSVQESRTLSDRPQLMPARIVRAAGGLIFVATLGGLVLAIAGSSPPASLAVVAACAVSFVLQMWRPQLALGWAVGVVAVTALLGAAAGLVVQENESSPPPIRNLCSSGRPTKARTRPSGVCCGCTQGRRTRTWSFCATDPNGREAFRASWRCHPRTSYALTTR